MARLQDMPAGSGVRDEGTLADVLKDTLHNGEFGKRGTWPFLGTLATAGEPSVEDKNKK